VRPCQPGTLDCSRLVDVTANAGRAITIIVRQRSLHRVRTELDDGGARMNIVCEFGDDGAENSDLGEELCFVRFEFADPVVGLV
jgi:hypothetical protein